MKLSTVLEDIQAPLSSPDDVLPKSKKSSSNTSGTQGKTEAIKGDKTAFYKKELGKITPYVNEINAYEILKEVNRAGRMYGMNTDVVPLPHIIKWDVEEDKGIVITSQNNPAKNNIEKMNYEKFDIFMDKVLFAKVFISDNDIRHAPNYYSAKGKQGSSYTFDYGYAFGFDGSGHLINYIERKTKEFLRDNVTPAAKKAKISKMLNYLHFWDSFLDHNLTPVLDIIEKNREDIKSKLNDEEKYEIVESRSHDIRYAMERNFKNMSRIIKRTIGDLEEWAKPSTNEPRN